LFPLFTTDNLSFQTNWTGAFLKMGEKGTEPFPSPNPNIAEKGMLPNSRWRLNVNLNSIKILTTPKEKGHVRFL
jgi:hypothetical protein